MSGEVRAVTVRSMGVSAAVIAASVLFNEWMTYYISGSNISRSHFPLAFFFPFLTVCTLNILVRGLRPGWELSRAELLVVLGTGLVGISVSYDGVTGHLVGILGAPYYFASSENGWALYLHEHIPSWLAPRNTGDEMVWFFEGVPGGGAPGLEAWVTPLFWWTCLLGAMAFAVFCMVVMLRKQWSEHERLAYPLVEVGQMLTETEAGGRLPAFFRSPLFWLGFGLVMALKMWNVASYFSPAFPRISIEGRYWQAFPDFPYLITRISFYAIGFGYFARLDVLFSVWFFHYSDGGRAVRVQPVGLYAGRVGPAVDQPGPGLADDGGADVSGLLGVVDGQATSGRGVAKGAASQRRGGRQRRVAALPDGGVRAGGVAPVCDRMALHGGDGVVGGAGVPAGGAADLPGAVPGDRGAGAGLCVLPGAALRCGAADVRHTAGRAVQRDDAVVYAGLQQYWEGVSDAAVHTGGEGGGQGGETGADRWGDLAGAGAGVCAVDGRYPVSGV